MTNSDDINRILEDFGEQLAAMRHDVASGAALQLAGLPARTQDLCDSVLAMPTEKAQALVDHLSALVTQTTELAESIRTESRRLQERIEAQDPGQ